MKIFSIVLLCAMFGATAFAQQDAKVIAETWVSGDKVVKGQPFSADAVSESVQTLSDGNRIVHNSTTKLYRNGEGRFRREIAGGTGGVMGTAYSFEPGVTITDQLGGRLLLDSTMRTVRPLAMVEPRKIEIPSLTTEQKAALEKLRVELKLTDTAKITDEQRQTIKKLKEELNITIPLIVTPEGFKPAHSITTTVNGSLFGGSVKAMTPMAPLTGALTLRHPSPVSLSTKQRPSNSAAKISRASRPKEHAASRPSRPEPSVTSVLSRPFMKNGIRKSCSSWLCQNAAIPGLESRHIV
ncbi:MAG: hypothetical protein IPK98_19355 [Chloracidobacterium sp.]|nr:hypothetical protein [Chloracidobacterium sp.]